MGLQKFRFDKEGTKHPNGSIELITQWMGGPTLAGVKNCPTEFGPRMVYITGEPDTFFSIPASCKYKGKTYKGFVTSDETGLVFHVYKGK